MSISAEEATYCIFNDIRVTSSKLTPDKIAHTILDNRKIKLSIIILMTLIPCH